MSNADRGFDRDTNRDTDQPPQVPLRTATWRGLRGRVTILFAVGALTLSALLAVSVYTISRGYLSDQRERTVTRQAALDADRARARLARVTDEPSTDLPASAASLLADLDPPAGTLLVLRAGDRWFAVDTAAGPDLLPSEVRAAVGRGEVAAAPVDVNGTPHLVLGVPLDLEQDAGAALYEIAPLAELRETLQVLAAVLIACAACATLAGAAVGLWAAGRVLRPVHQLADTAASIAAGRYDSRLPATADPDLAALTTSFNDMVDSLQRRIERERRFVGDVSHELRSPVTTLTTTLEMLERRRDELPDRSRRALDLATAEISHLRRLLDHLLALARAEAGLHQDDPETLDFAALVTHVVTSAGHPAAAVIARSSVTIRGHKLALHRAVRNLVDNADIHGGGMCRVVVHAADGDAILEVHDGGPGVALDDRQRVFARFATGSHGRGSTAGTGLGLALVRELITAHGGTVMCGPSPDGGAVFVVRLRLVPSGTGVIAPARATHDDAG